MVIKLYDLNYYVYKLVFIKYGLGLKCWINYSIEHACDENFKHCFYAFGDYLDGSDIETSICKYIIIVGPRQP